MNHLRHLTFILTATTLLSACRKSNDPVEIHCKNLVNNKPASDQFTIMIPNAFTPNGDGLNDYFFPLIFDPYNSYSFKIYDKNSHLVFEATQGNAKWNYVPPMNTKFDKFYYRIEVVTTQNNNVGLCGEVTPMICIPPGKSINSFVFQDQATPSGFTGVTNETLVQCN